MGPHSWTNGAERKQQTVDTKQGPLTSGTGLGQSASSAGSITAAGCMVRVQGWALRANNAGDKTNEFNITVGSGTIIEWLQQT